MVARALSKSQSTFRGARLFDPATDLNGVAHLLEEAFRPDNNFPFSTTPWLREFGIALWTLNYTPGMGAPMGGLVWVEDEKIVGNVSLSADYSHSDRYYISNVAIKLDYRRQGIARALMQATLSHLREHHVEKVFLNVRPNNPGAIELYAELGFKSLETRGEWSLAALPQSENHTQASVEGLRPLKMTDHKRVTELLRAAVPENVARYRAGPNVFTLALDELIAEKMIDWLMGQSTRRWVLERDGKLAAILYLRGQRLLTPHKIAAQVHPDFRGHVETELVDKALSELATLPAHAIRAEAVSIYPEWVNALERAGFRFWNGLTLMELTLA